MIESADRLTSDIYTWRRKTRHFESRCGANRQDASRDTNKDELVAYILLLILLFLLLLLSSLFSLLSVAHPK